MNKTISSRLAISIILFLSLFTGFFLWQTNENSFPAGQAVSYDLAKLNLKKTGKNDSCLTVFEGNAEIRVWQEMENNERVIKIFEEDAFKMPRKDCTYFELIDSNPNLEKKLDSSSQKNPVEITITGFAKRCSGRHLASLKYKDKIFRPFL